jgi:hypothetical protein
MSLFMQSVYAASALSLAVVFLLYRSHPFRRLPSGPVVVAFATGMASVVGVSLVRGLLSWEASVATALLGSAALEEGWKLVALAATTWRLRYPNLIEPYDFAVLFGIIGIGFGVYEDFSYIFSASYPSWVEGDIIRFHLVFGNMMLARSLPGHVLFDATAGYLIGVARFRSSGARRLGWLIGGAGLAVGLHAAYNAIAVHAGWMALLTYTMALVGLLLAMRQHAARTSPFVDLIERIERPAATPAWHHSRSPMELLFAEGFSWPSRSRGGLFQFYPVVLSLAVLFPLLFIAVYFVQRVTAWLMG